MNWFGKKQKSSPDGNAGNAQSLLQEAHHKLEAGFPVEALKLTQRIEALGSPLPETFFLQGICLDRVGRHEEAMHAFAREAEINPAHPHAKGAHERLAKALARPVIEKIPNHLRPYNTSLARENLHSIQQSLHNYQYRGVPMLKNPFDAALYPMLLWKLKPKTIIEIGSKSGGSALWFGDLLDNYQSEARVLSIDIVKVENVEHARVTFMEGDGRRLEKVLTPDLLKKLKRPWLVIEDADHSYETSKAVLKFFDPLLQAGEYIVVEDGIISDLSDDPECNSGPHRALKEFLGKRGSEYEIDGDYCDFFGYNVTWCTNGFLKKVPPGRVQPTDPKSDKPISVREYSPRGLLNLGCGKQCHPDWLNIDVAKTADDVVAHDLRKPLPLPDASCAVVYASHVLEHFAKAEAPQFLAECFRVLEPGGIIRIVVPDLEQIARLYVDLTQRAATGDVEAAARYEWIVLELMDQLTRESSGGEMLRYWMQNPMPAENFVTERMGNEVTSFINEHRPPAGQAKELARPKYSPEQVGKFRAGGEVHKWMYDRYSLGRILQDAGFKNVKVCAAAESRIPGFNQYQLDVLADGGVRKPDSLFMEAEK